MIDKKTYVAWGIFEGLVDGSLPEWEVVEAATRVVTLASGGYLFRTNAFQLYGARKEKRERELLTLSPEERYRSFSHEYPMLSSRIPQKDIARYLGVTPVGLCRIKKRLGASTCRFGKESNN